MPPLLAFPNLFLEVILASSEREGMKAKRVKIGVRPPGTIFDEATEVLQRLSATTLHSFVTRRTWLYEQKARANSDSV